MSGGCVLSEGFQSGRSRSNISLYYYSITIVSLYVCMYEILIYKIIVEKVEIFIFKKNNNYA